MILPPYLSDLGYGNHPVIQKLEKMSWKETNESIEFIKPWDNWRDIFEYLGCVEFAKKELLDLLKGPITGSVGMSARYNSSSLIFFAQALLDNIAGWLCNYCEIIIHKSQIVFHKQQFKTKLTEIIPEFTSFLEEYESLITDIELFRSEWIHRMIGGAEIYSNKNPGEPNASISIMIPVDPRVKKLEGISYIQKVEELNQEYGNWLYTLEEFIFKFSEGTKKFTLDCLGIIINHSESNAN